MQNLIGNNFPTTPKTEPFTLDKIFSSEVLEKINQFKNYEMDYLIIRGLPVSSQLPDTPSKIRDTNQPALETIILKTVANSLGTISEKGVENTIRFNTEGDQTNIETWHCHFQYNYSCFYCLRGDAAATTYFLSANEIMKEAGEIANFLTTPFKYIENFQKFSLIEPKDGRYIFSKHIFDRSDLEKHIQDLDLPDAQKLLESVSNNPPTPEAGKAISYLLQQMKNARNHISYIPGDIMMVHEPSTIRYSPAFSSSTPIKQARWLLAISLI